MPISHNVVSVSPSDQFVSRINEKSLKDLLDYYRGNRKAKEELEKRVQKLKEERRNRLKDKEYWLEIRNQRLKEERARKKTEKDREREDRKNKNGKTNYRYKDSQQKEKEYEVTSIQRQHQQPRHVNADYYFTTLPSLSDSNQQYQQIKSNQVNQSVTSSIRHSAYGKNQLSSDHQQLLQRRHKPISNQHNNNPPLQNKMVGIPESIEDEGLRLSNSNESPTHLYHRRMATTFSSQYTSPNIPIVQSSNHIWLQLIYLIPITIHLQSKLVELEKNRFRSNVCEFISRRISSTLFNSCTHFSTIAKQNALVVLNRSLSGLVLRWRFRRRRAACIRLLEFFTLIKTSASIKRSLHDTSVRSQIVILQRWWRGRIEYLRDQEKMLYDKWIIVEEQIAETTYKQYHIANNENNNNHQQQTNMSAKGNTQVKH